MDANKTTDDYLLINCFNPRARDGREGGIADELSVGHVSIHAPVMDANGYVDCHLTLNSFNPRARDGREYLDKIYTYCYAVSIHAPVMDANNKIMPFVKQQVFQSTRP